MRRGAGGRVDGSYNLGLLPTLFMKPIIQNRGRTTKEGLHKWASVLYLAGRAVTSFLLLSLFKPKPLC